MENIVEKIIGNKKVADTEKIVGNLVGKGKETNWEDIDTD